MRKIDGDLLAKRVSYHFARGRPGSPIMRTKMFGTDHSASQSLTGCPFST